MDLVLWRHAIAVDADESIDDMQRPLTALGEAQAAEMAQWLNRHLPKSSIVLCSPALRTRQTMMHLGKKNYQLCPEIAPGASVEQLLHTANWPDSEQTVVVVGHQPTLGLTAQYLLGMQVPCAVKKGAVWWLRRREREGQAQVVLMAVQNPRML